MLRAAKSRQEVEPSGRNDSTAEEAKSKALSKQRSRSRERGGDCGPGRIRIHNILAEMDTAELLAIFKNVNMKIVAEV